MATATHGSAIVFPTEAFSPLDTLLAVQNYNCTALYGVPTMFLSELDMLRDPKIFVPSTQTEENDATSLTEGGDRSSSAAEVPLLRPDFAFKLRTGIAAGSSIPSQLMRRLHRTLNLTQLTICYGMTETSPVSAMTTTDDPIDKRVETVGRALPHVTAKVMNPDKGEVCGVGERGELWVSGYLVMKGYWGDEEKTEEVLIEDEQGTTWMRTGDEARIDEDGYVTITGRLKDIIIRGGENIHPLDVENCLLGLERQIVEVSAYGVPDERYGEVVGVSVMRRKNSDPAEELGEEEVRAWIRERLGKWFGESTSLPSPILALFVFISPEC